MAYWAWRESRQHYEQYDQASEHDCIFSECGQVHETDNQTILCGINVIQYFDNFQNNRTTKATKMNPISTFRYSIVRGTFYIDLTRWVGS